MGLLDMGNLGGDPNNPNYLRNQRLLGLASGLLASSGYSKTPVSIGQALGTGLQGMQQYGQAAQQELLAKSKEGRLKQQQDLINQLYTKMLPKGGGSGLPVGYTMKMTPRGPEISYDPIAAAKAVHEGIVPEPGQPQTPELQNSPYSSVNVADLTPAARQSLAAKRAAEAPKAYASMDNLQSTLDSMVKAAEDLKNDPSIQHATGLEGTVTTKVPGTSTYDYARKLDTLKSKIMLNMLTGMKQLSSNGSSGFGQLSNAEGDVLKNYLGNLDLKQSPEQLSKNLDKIIEYAKGLKGRTLSTYEMTYGPLPQEPQQTGAQPATKTIVRTGMLNGRKVVQYSDGTTAYAD